MRWYCRHFQELVVDELMYFFSNIYRKERMIYMYACLFSQSIIFADAVYIIYSTNIGIEFNLYINTSL